MLSPEFIEIWINFFFRRIDMAFVGERIPEMDKSKIDMEKLWKISSYFIEPTRWAVDREHDVYLFHLRGSGPERPAFFGMYVQGEIVIFRAYEGGTGNNKNGVVLSYKISNLRIPQALEAQSEEIKQLIQEALDAYGLYGDRSHVKAVYVEFTVGRG
jgi:hypothetical protein